MRELKIYFASSVAAKLLVLTTTIVVKLLVFKVATELRRGIWEKSKIKIPESSLLLKVRYFSWINSSWTVERLQLISGVLKSSLWPFFLCSCNLWRSRVLEVLTLPIQKCSLIALFNPKLFVILRGSKYHQIHYKYIPFTATYITQFSLHSINNQMDWDKKGRYLQSQLPSSLWIPWTSHAGCVTIQTMETTTGSCASGFKDWLNENSGLKRIMRCY